MRTIPISLLVGLAVLGLGAAGELVAQDRKPLRSVDSFNDIADARERSAALFTEAAKVFTHPRCINCHPAGDRPKQGERGELHQPMVVRGKDGFGAPGMRCSTCHGPANFDPGRVPGHPQWHLAPREMTWEGKSLTEICEQIKDPRRNGGKNSRQLAHHNAEDSLVSWGWAPHPGREPAPGTQKQFGELIRAWLETGAACPSR
jgi:hypothetical protein